MPSFIYITDVFCPWCFGFAPVLRKLKADYGFPVRVLCGELVDEPTLTSTMSGPRMQAFFRRLSETTGREIGEAFFRLTEPENGVIMDSSRSALLMAALKKLDPGRALEQMEAFQDAFYSEGRDVLSPAVQAEVAGRWGIGRNSLEEALVDGAVREKADREMAGAEELLGDFVVYPTLFVKTDDGVVHAVARGYGPFEDVAGRIDAALAAGEAGDAVSGHACGLDGRCC